MKVVIKKLAQFFIAPSHTNHETEAALDIIEKHGMKAHFYLPAVGNRDDAELSQALDFLSSRGFIITEPGGGLVGKVATARPDSSEVATSRRAAFKVVD